MNENTPVELSTTVNKQYTKNLKVELKSQDINNHMFELSFKDIELDSTYTIIILSVFKNAGTELKSSAKIEDGKAYFVFDTSFITGNDTVVNYVYLKQGIKTSDITSFSFKVSLSKIDDGAREVAQYYDFHYENMLEDFKKELDDYIESLPDRVIVEDKPIDLSKYALKTDLPDMSKYVRWEDVSDIEGNEYDDTEIRNEIAKKQDKLKAGDNIIINSIDNTISAINTVPDLKPYALKSDLPDLSSYATKNEIPDTSDFITLEDLPEIDNYDDTEIKKEISTKQDKLIVGENITIEDNKISAIVPEVDLSPYALATDIPDTSNYITLEDLPEDKDTTYTAGENIIISEDNVISSISRGSSEELEWIEATLAGTWSNLRGTYPLSYAKDSKGYIHLRGTVNIYPYGEQSVIANITTLPEGYRPQSYQDTTIPIGIVDNGTKAIEYISISSSSGKVDLGRVVKFGTNSKVYFENISFFAGK